MMPPAMPGMLEMQQPGMSGVVQNMIQRLCQERFTVLTVYGFDATTDRHRIYTAQHVQGGAIVAIST